MDKTKEVYQPLEVTLIEFQVERGIASSVIGNVQMFMDLKNDGENIYTESEGTWEDY